MMDRQRFPSPHLSVLLLAALGLLPLYGCASLTGDPSAAEIAELKQRLNEERRNATVGEIEVARLRDELATAKAALRRAEEELARRRSDDTLRAEAPIRASRPIDQAELEDPVPAAPPVPPPTAVPSRPSTLAEEVGAAGEAAPGASGAVGEDPQVLYDRGYTLFHQKSYDLAEASFRTFLARFPDSELADNALFWIGESHYAKGDYEAALAVFAETVARFPQGNKVSDALLKAGRSLEQLGRVDEAASTYREVQERFPGSVAAAGAKERLDALGPGPGKGRSKPG
jgi:tol-pal system protein YbgF